MTRSPCAAARCRHSGHAAPTRPRSSSRRRSRGVEQADGLLQAPPAAADGALEGEQQVGAAGCAFLVRGVGDPGAQHPAAPYAGLGPVEQRAGAGRGQHAVPPGVERGPQLVGDAVEFGVQAGPASRSGWWTRVSAARVARSPGRRNASSSRAPCRASRSSRSSRASGSAAWSTATSTAASGTRREPSRSGRGSSRMPRRSAIRSITSAAVSPLTSRARSCAPAGGTVSGGSWLTALVLRWVRSSRSARVTARCRVQARSPRAGTTVTRTGQPSPRNQGGEFGGERDVEPAGGGAAAGAQPRVDGLGAVGPGGDPGRDG